MTTTLKDLGTKNAGGEIEKRIDEAKAICRAAGHDLTTINEGPNGTWHTVQCPKCGYQYNYDSGD